MHWLFLIDRKWLFLFGSTWLIQPDANNVKIDDIKEMSDLICGKAAVGGNYNSTRDNLVAEMSFSAELVDVNNPEAGMKYLLNGKEISYDEYTAFGSKIFAAEESTN